MDKHEERKNLLDSLNGMSSKEIQEMCKKQLSEINASLKTREDIQKRYDYRLSVRELFATAPGGIMNGAVEEIDEELADLLKRLNDLR